MKERRWLPYWFSTPLVIFILLFMAYPIFYGIFLGFHEWDGLGAMKFIGFDNYRTMFQDKVFWKAFANTFVYAAISMVGNVGLGLFLALAVVKRRSVNFYRVVFYLPILLSGTAVALIWSRIYEPYTGILNTVLNAVGLEAWTNQWLGNADTAMGATLVVAIWKHCGFPMVLFLTAIMSVPGDVYEAAKLDGVNSWQETLYITIPMIRGQFLTIVMLQLVNAMKAFDTIWVMTGGGPGTATTVLTLEIYLEAFRHSEYGYASALSTILIAIIVLIAAGFKKLTACFED